MLQIGLISRGLPRSQKNADRPLFINFERYKHQVLEEEMPTDCVTSKGCELEHLTVRELEKVDTFAESVPLSVIVNQLMIRDGVSSPKITIAVGLRPSNSSKRRTKSSRPSSSRRSRILMSRRVRGFSSENSRKSVLSPMSFFAFYLSRSRKTISPGRFSMRL